LLKKRIDKREVTYRTIREGKENNVYSNNFSLAKHVDDMMHA
jgi:hypothetical protein